MKKISVLICFVFIFVIFSGNTIFAENENTAVQHGPFTVKPRSLCETQEGLSALAERENAVFKTEFRDVIDDNSQILYDFILSNYEKLKSGTDTITLDYNSGYKYTSQAGVINDMNYALGALDFDCIEFYWLDISKISFSYTAKGDEIKLYIKAASGESNYFIDGYSDKSEVEEDLNKMNAVIEEVTSQVKDKSRYEQILYFNDFLVKKNEYNRFYGTDEISRFAYGPISSLVYGSTDLTNTENPVCEGYSRGLKLLCNKVGIPCILVSGGGHMWNAVQMEDGVWYCVDSTYNDPVFSSTPSESYIESIKNRYTLVGTGTSVSGTAFEEKHTPGGAFLVYGADKCVYPDFSVVAYEEKYYNKLLLEKVLNDDFILSEKVTVRDLDADGIFTASDVAMAVLNGN